MSNTRLRTTGPRPVSQPHDTAEREAKRAGSVVARGGSVAGWSFSGVPATVQRQETPKPKTDEEKYKEAAAKVAEAAAETPQGKAVKEKVLADPLVKTVKDAATSTPGMIATGVAAAGGVAALGAAKKPLPFQPPAIPLDKITPGLSAQVRLDGPVNAPSFVGLTLTYKEQGPKGKKTSESEKIAADVDRLKREQEMFKPQSQKAAEKKQEQELVDAWVRSQSGTLPGLQIPLKGTPEKKADDAPKKDEEQTPVQRAPASPSAASPEHADVDDAFASSGRPLEPATRRAMETRFRYDFSAVRVHDDARAAAKATELDAAAFTVGPDIAFAAGRYSPSTSQGRELLAHELAHTVQHGAAERGGGTPVARALADLPEEDRKRIQIVTSSVTVPGLAEKFATTGTKVTFPFPAGVTAATFETGVDPALQHGLSNVAAVLSNGTDITPTPLVENSTITLELDVPSKGKGLYRFTYDAPPAPPGGKAPAPKILVEALGAATAPAGTKAPVAEPGKPPPADPVADKIKKYSLSQSYSGTELDALRAAIDQIPEAQLAVVSGLKFARDTAKQNDPAAAGDYDPKTHTVTMYDKAFTPSQSRFKGAGTTASEGATRAIVHEIGHAIDLTPLRKAGADKDKADAAVDALSTKYPDPKDKTKYSYPLGGPEEKDVKATLKAQEDAEAALTKARATSGTQSVKQPTGEFKDVIGSQVQGNKFREAMAKDGGKAVSAYGQTDFQEAFAEAYSLYITSPDTLKALRPNVYDFLDKNLPK